MIKGHNINKWPLKNPQGDIRDDEKDIKKISMMADLDMGVQGVKDRRTHPGVENGVYSPILHPTAGQQSRLGTSPSFRRTPKVLRGGNPVIKHGKSTILTCKLNEETTNQEIL